MTNIVIYHYTETFNLHWSDPVDMSDAVTSKVEQYYTTTQELYDESMEENDHSSIHFGYFDEEHTGRETAVQNMNRVLANIADITKGDRVLHCGCGIGGPATWLAKNRGATAVGINRPC